MDTGKDMSTEMDAKRTNQQIAKIATEMDTVYRTYRQLQHGCYRDNTRFTGNYTEMN